MVNNMDGRQFLKEARELYRKEKHEPLVGMQDVSDVVKGWGKDDYSIDTFKKTLCHYTDNSGHVTNYLFALLHSRPVSERLKETDFFDNPMTEKIKEINKRVDEESHSMYESWELLEVYTLQLVLDNFDQIVNNFKRMFAEHDSIRALNKALLKYPSLDTGGDLGPKVKEAIDAYSEIMKANADIETYKKMTELCKNLCNGNPQLAKIIRDSSSERALCKNTLTKHHGSIEDIIKKVLLDAMKDKLLYWDDENIHFLCYMRITDVTMDGYENKAIHLHGDFIHFDYTWKPQLEQNCSKFLSYMKSLDKDIKDLHVVEIDELLKEVEKHTPFMLDFIKKLTDNMV